MSDYKAPIKDIQFLLNNLEIDDKSSRNDFSDQELVNQIFEEAGKLATNVLAPLNIIGDQEGASLENGLVRMPKASLTDFCMPMMSARGCTFKCTFCYRMDPGYRKRSAEDLLDEVEMLHKDYGITLFVSEGFSLFPEYKHLVSIKAQNYCKSIN